MARQVKYDFNPFKLTGESAAGIKDKAGTLRKISKFITNSVRDNNASATSSVAKKGRFQRLSAAYAKSQKSGNRTANLKLKGNLEKSLNTHKLDGNKLRTTVSETEQPKADGHNNFSGNSSLPTRQFIPDAKDGQTWKRAMIDGMREIIRKAKA